MKKKFLLQNGLIRKKQITQHAIGWHFPSQFETIFSQPTFVLQVLNEQCS